MGCDCSGGFTEWSVDYVDDVLQQDNCYDCGVFTYMFTLLLYVELTIYIDQKLINGKE